MPSTLKRLYAVWVGVVIAFYTGARVRLGDPNGAEMGASDPLNTVLTLSVLICGVGLVLRFPRRALSLLAAMVPFLLMLSIMVLSALWSDSAENTIRRSVTMAGVLLFALSTQITLGPERFMRISVGATLTVAVLSLLEAVLRPAYGFDTGDYANAIRGLYGQKNTFGMGLLAGALALSFGVLHRGRLRLSDPVILLFLLLCLVLSRSTTSLLLTCAISGITLMMLALASPGVPRIVVAIALLSGGFATVLLLSTVQTAELLDLIGKDSSLTGRTEIWEAIDEAIARRPLLGYGYAAFWIEGSANVLRVWDHVAWEVISAHSGYREVMVQFGLVGIMLLVFLVASTLVFTVRAALRGEGRISVWLLMFLGVLAVLNNSESVLLGPSLMMIYWIVAVLTLAGVPTPARCEGGVRLRRT